jgi:hypothetical protein
MRDYDNPALALLMLPRWDAALAWLHAVSADHATRGRLDDVMANFADRAALPAVIGDVVEDLYAVGTPRAGALALAWQMMMADPRHPATFRFLPQLQYALDQAELDPGDDADVRARLRIWWRAAEGEWLGSEVSIFRIADIEAQADTYRPLERPPVLSGPSLVVMPKDRATKLNNHHAAYKEVVDAALPLVRVARLPQLRAALHAEFPHATAAVDLLLRDLREGKPFRLNPVCLVGPSGAGKSRLVRRLLDLVIGMYLYRFDAGAAGDNHFAGTSKGWANTEASVPMRAIAQYRIANPTILLDEIDKAATSPHGQLSHALLGYLDRETSSRMRDQSLDAQVDLSHVSYIATANDPEKISGPLRDRFRMIRVPAPTLAHLPALAASVMLDLAIEDEARAHDALLAADELDVIAMAWRRAGFSMRSLQKIVRATLDARDEYAMRH